MPWTLATLPTQIIGQVLNGPSSFLFLPLWATGDRLLQKKLSEGVTELDLRDGHGEETDFFTIPPLIANLPHLRSFILHVQSKRCKNDFDAKSFLSKLPQTLKTLDIDWTNCSHLFYDDPQDAAPTNGFSVVSSSSASNGSRITLPAQLETLKIGPGQTEPLKTFLASDLCAIIPKSLTMLQVNTIEFNSAADFLALPRTLVNLHCNVDWKFFDLARNANDWQSCPDTLTHVRNINHIPAEALACLPRSIHYESVSNLTEVWTLDSARTAPPLIEALTVYRVEHAQFEHAFTDWVSELPKGLVWLDLYHHGRLPFAPYIEHLPASLTFLSVANGSVYNPYMDWDAIKDLVERKGGVDNLWPSKLLFLELYAQSTLPCHIKLMPRSLTSLSIEIDSEDWDESVVEASDLPPNLKTLSFSEYDTMEHHNLVFSMNGNPPASITAFNARATHVIFDANCLKNFSNALRSLDIVLPVSIPSRDHPLVGPFYLPPQLTLLCVTNFCYEWFGAIPKSVTHLTFFDLHGSGRIINGGGNDGSDGNVSSDSFDPFSELPSDLKYLWIDESQLDDVSIYFPLCSFKALSQLEHLHISSKHRFTSKVLRNFPSSLRTLQIEMDRLEDEDAPFVPSRLFSQLSIQYTADVKDKEDINEVDEDQ